MGGAADRRGAAAPAGQRPLSSLANERTQDGDASLDDHWAPWWGARRRGPRLRLAHLGPWQLDGRPCRMDAIRPSMGPAGRRVTMDAADLLRRTAAPADRFQAMTGQAMGHWFRAPAARPRAHSLLVAARACGWTPVGWAGGLPGRRAAQRALPERATAAARCSASGPATSWWRTWASGRAAILGAGGAGAADRGPEARGLCFATLREHPRQLGGADGRAVGTAGRPRHGPDDAFDRPAVAVRALLQPLMFHIGLGPTCWPTATGPPAGCWWACCRWR